MSLIVKDHVAKMMHLKSFCKGTALVNFSLTADQTVFLLSGATFLFRDNRDFRDPFIIVSRVGNAGRIKSNRIGLR